MDAIRVLLVDDHPMIRRGLRSLLSCYGDIEVVGDAECGAGALQLAKELSPDVILLDVKMPGPSGLRIAHQLRRLAPAVRIIILSAYDDEEYVLGALRAGACAYLLKTTSDETVVDAIKQVYRDAFSLSPSQLGRVLQEFQVLAGDHSRHELGVSEQELQMLTLLAGGATTREISETMHWSERSVKRRLQEVLEKFGASTRTQAVAEAISQGLI